MNVKRKKLQKPFPNNHFLSIYKYFVTDVVYFFKIEMQNQKYKPQCFDVKHQYQMFYCKVDVIMIYDVKKTV